jgi:hypothetical protein
MSDDDKIKVTLPDGAILDLRRGSTVADVASRIGPGLAKAALGAEVSGLIVDLMHPLDQDTSIRILTAGIRRPSRLLRHSAAHVLATAVRELRSRELGIGFGPAIEEGFYYDFEVPSPSPRRTWRPSRPDGGGGRRRPPLRAEAGDEGGGPGPLLRRSPEAGAA